MFSAGGVGHVVRLCRKRQQFEGGSTDPMNRRLIVLLPVAYRLWAALRVRLMLDRRRGACVAGRIRCGCRHIGGEGWGLDLELAHVDSSPVSGLALDFSECYVILPLALLREGARRAGVPPVVTGLGFSRRGSRRWPSEQRARRRCACEGLRRSVLDQVIVPHIRKLILPALESKDAGIPMRACCQCPYVATQPIARRFALSASPDVVGRHRPR